MKIRITDIPYEGLKIEDSLSLENLTARMNEGDNRGIVFTVAPKVTLTVFRSTLGAETKGTVTTRYKQPCSLCVEEVEKDIEIEANYILKPRDPVNLDALDDDVGVVFYDGEHVDLEDVIQESLILALNIYWHPPQDKDGNCVRCGLNFCAKQASEDKPVRTMGDIFKKALSKN